MIVDRALLYFVLFLSLFSQGLSSAIARGDIANEGVIVDVASFPPIDEDVRALSQFSRQAKEAGFRLVERGDEILTVAHGILADANAPYAQRLQMLYILGEIGNPQSATEIIHAIEDFPNNRYLYQNALLALSNFEPTEEINAFVNRQLEDTQRDPLLQRSALNYYAKQPNDDANQWVEKYALNSNANPEVRYTALYMAGMNGVDAVKAPIGDVLDSTRNTIREYYLLLGFAGVASMEEFDALVKEKNLNSVNVKKAREFLAFRLANAEQKKAIASEALKSNNSQLKRVAVDHFINVKDADALSVNWGQGDSFVRSALKRSGYEIDITDDGAKLTERQHDHKDTPLWLYVLVIVGLILGAIVWRQKITTRNV